MKISSVLARAVVVLTIAGGSSALGWAAGCSGGKDSIDDVSVDSGIESGVGAACVACVSDKDCSGGVCAQLGGDTYCAPACPTGNECTSDRSCAPVSTASGDQRSVCVPRGDVCGPPSDAPDGATPPTTCGTLVGPDVTAGCSCSSGKTCTANGCYGGWWCNTATNRCQSPPSPSSCGAAGDGGASPGVPYDAGGPVTAQIGADGGTTSRLFFGIVGDTRPATNDDTAGYPTPIITKIYTDVAAMDPMPPFMVSTGDYVFAVPTGTQAEAQLDLYLGARAKYAGVLFPTMGNHECTGFTASNCGAGNVDGTTNNFTTYLSKMLAPIGKTDVYYEVDVAAADASWTSKFLFVAGNAWSAVQSAWLDQAMARPTTYTFIVRHEPANATTAPGVPASEAIMTKYPYTLALTGHTHTYSHYTGSRQIVIGNGGAPLTGGKNFGFALVSQKTDGNVAVDMIDYATGLADPAFSFSVKPDGSAAP
jgi:hypothetical protein